MTLGACVKEIGIKSNPSSKIYTVAVLPPFNATSEIDGPQMIRKLVHERMLKRHYKARPLAEVDSALRDRMSVVFGEQLEFATPQRVGSTLGVDGLIYIYILNFDDKTIGENNVKRVRAGIKLVDAITGKVVWSKGRGVKGEITGGDGISPDSGEGLDEFKAIQGLRDIPDLDIWTLLYRRRWSAMNAMITSIGTMVFGVDTKSHLNYESREMLDALFDGMIAGPGVPAAAPDARGGVRR